MNPAWTGANSLRFVPSPSNLPFAFPAALSKTRLKPRFIPLIVSYLAPAGTLGSAPQTQTFSFSSCTVFRYLVNISRCHPSAFPRRKALFTAPRPSPASSMSHPRRTPFCPIGQLHRPRCHSIWRTKVHSAIRRVFCLYLCAIKQRTSP